ncbi:MAG: hypothetical protein IE923_04315 [Micrococcales bacterium]|nr:hypothetical protein [Micrococcales bacterium]
MMRTRTWRRLTAVALALATAGVGVPLAAADEAPAADEIQRAYARFGDPVTEPAAPEADPPATDGTESTDGTDPADAGGAPLPTTGSSPAGDDAGLVPDEVPDELPADVPDDDADDATVPPEGDLETSEAPAAGSTDAVEPTAAVEHTAAAREASADGAATPVAVAAASRPATLLGAAGWDYFRSLNQTRLGARVEPVVRHGALGTLAEAWATRQASQGTWSLDPDIASKVPGTPLDGYQAIYRIPATSADAAIRAARSSYLVRDAVDANLTDVGLAVVESPGYGSTRYYTIYQIVAEYSHSAPRSGETTLYRFYRPSSGTHFYSTSKGERNTVIGDAGFRYEGPVAYLLTSGSATAGARALHRFYQPGTGTHFYTSTTREYQTVRTLPQYRLDGSVGKVHTRPAAGLTAMHRFFRPASGTHFYTASPSELAAVKKMPGYRYEGVAFYLRKAS